MGLWTHQEDQTRHPNSIAILKGNKPKSISDAEKKTSH
jgi:hypothetical protein